MDKLSVIMDGWKNLIISNPVTEELAVKRMNTCLSCIHYKELTDRCDICGCYMPAGVRAKEKKCPKGKW